MQVGIFISEYDSGGSHTRSFVKCLAERDILVDIFLCNPMGYKSVDTFSYGIDGINVYYFKRNWDFVNRSNKIFVKSIRWIYTLIISIYFKVVTLIIKVGLFIKIKSESLLIPIWVQKETQHIINNKEYNLFFGVEAQGLVYAGMMGKKYNVPYIYHSYELFTIENPNGSGKMFLSKFNLLKNLEKEYHQNAITTIIQDEDRKNILYNENNIRDIPICYMPVSIKGEKKLDKGNYFQNLFNIDSSKKIILQYGSIYNERYSKEIAMISNDLPDNFVLVLHGQSNLEYVNKLNNNNNSDKLFISTELVEPDYISDLISSAYIGLSFYNTEDPNCSLSGLSSHKLAHYTQCGIPVISNNFQSINKVMNNIEFGICIDSFDYIPTAIKEIDDNYDQFKNNSYKAFDNIYNIDNYSNLIVELIK